MDLTVTNKLHQGRAITFGEMTDDYTSIDSFFYPKSKNKKIAAAQDKVLKTVEQIKDNRFLREGSDIIYEFDKKGGFSDYYINSEFKSIRFFALNSCVPELKSDTERIIIPPKKNKKLEAILKRIEEYECKDALDSAIKNHLKNAIVRLSRNQKLKDANKIWTEASNRDAVARSTMKTAIKNVLKRGGAKHKILSWLK